MSKIGDLAIKVGEYEKDGEKKGKYTNVGVLMQGENGMFALLDPTVDLAGALVCQRLLNPQKAGDRVMCSVFEKRAQTGSQAAPQASGGGAPFDDDLPFMMKETW